MHRVYAKHWKDYELIDAGGQKKLERWGNIITIRPEKNAYFSSVLSMKDWKEKAHFEFVEKSAKSGSWKELVSGTPREWQINFNNCTLNLRLTKFKHVGIFPEQQINWDFINSHLKQNDIFLNLFAYTGTASLIANAVGAKVFHCDSVRQIITWAKQNMESSNLSNIHWVLEDALKYANREVKRNNKYHGIIMDPPTFGLGTNKERWKIENKFFELIEIASQLLEKNGFLIVNTYSPKLKESEILVSIKKHFPKKKFELNKLCIKSTTGKVIEYGELTKIY